ncbi:hypothetical protein CW745_15405 [Psychromonas sp. psych-6C06]|uniref:hypothetical protein n=1 Tax=Psychromonas sp. psych-6C06 TaxID=2058089 RepID=UPI000C33C9A3|nr:hypothetical protein [Psychromonas sp. psych-6C06]PKF60330.1 hypothetical protein CW745_15405 [Psychromonas sp. psych-6C06]
MNSDKKLYIAGIGMISSIGGDTAMTTAAVEAGISGYQLSDFDSHTGEPLTLSLVSEDIFGEIEIKTGLKLDQGNRFNMRHDRITIMATIALKEACANLCSDKAVPFIMAQSEYSYDKTDLSSLVDNLANNAPPWIDSKLTRTLNSGRAAGIEAIDMIFNYLYDSEHDYFIVGGSDSYFDDALLSQLDGEGRLLYLNNADGFVAGEGATYLVLTKKPELALVKNKQVVALSPPGISEEKGHLKSKLPYKGEGLDAAFKAALINQPPESVSEIYSSMNGENHWAKELGVAQLRNKQYLAEQVTINHPAECYGDIGSATGPMLIALSAENLWARNTQHWHLVYSSSDITKRSAIVVETILVNKSL